MPLGRTFVFVVISGVTSRVSVALIVLIVTVSSGCAAGGYSTGSLHRRLEKAGLTSRQATCVLDRMVDRFGQDQLNARTRPILAEVRAERTLLHSCRVEVSRPR